LIENDSLDFTSLSEKSLVQLIKNDDLQMEETEIWKNVLKWGLKQNPEINSNPDTWSNNDFESMKNTLKNCLPLIVYHLKISYKKFVLIKNF